MRLISQVSWSRISPGSQAFLGYILVTIVGYGRLLFSRGTLGLYGDWPSAPLPAQLTAGAIDDTLRLWSEGFLGYLHTRQTGNYIDWITGGAAKLFHLGGPVLSKYPIILMPIAGYAMWRFLVRRGRASHQIAFAAGLLYLLAPVMFNSFVFGYLKFFVSIAAAPWFLTELGDYLETDELEVRRLVVLALSFGLVATQLNFMVLFGAFGLCYGLFVSEWQREKIRRLVIGLVIALLGAVSLQLQFFGSLLLQLTQMTSHQTIGLKGALQTFVVGRSPSPFEAVSLLGAASEAFAEFLKLHQLTVLWQFVRLPLFGLLVLPLLLLPKDRTVRFWSGVMVVTLFLLKGTQPPFGTINLWLLGHVPILAVIRNSQQITFISLFAYCSLFSISLGLLMVKRQREREIAVLGVACILLTSLPIILQGAGNFVSSYSLNSEMRGLFLKLADRSASRTVVLPSLQPVSRVRPDGSLTPPGPNPLAWYPPRPGLFMGVAPDRAPAMHAYLYGELMSATSQWLGSVLSLLNVADVVVDRHAESAYSQYVVSHEQPWFAAATKTENLLRTLGRQLDLHQEVLTPEVAHYTTSEPVGRVYAAHGLVLGLGDPRLLSDLAPVAQSVHSPLPDVVFGSQLSKERLLSITPSIAEVWAEENDLLELPLLFSGAAVLAPGALLNDRTSNANHHWVSLYKNQWWWYKTDLVSWREPIMTLGTEAVELPVQLDQSGPTHLLIRVFAGQGIAPLLASLDGRSVGSIELNDMESEGYHWIDLGQVDLDHGDHTLSLANPTGGLEAVSGISFVPAANWQQATVAAQEWLGNKPLTTVRYIGKKLSLVAPKILGVAKPESQLLVERNESIEQYSQALKSSVTGTVNEQEYSYNLDDPGFEHSTWTGARSCDQAVTEPLIEASLITPGHQGGHSLSLKSRRGLACVSSPIRHFDNTTSYHLHFSYFGVTGDTPHFSIVEDGVTKPMDPLGLPKGQGWQSFEYTYQPSLEASGANIVLYANAEKGEPTEAQFDQVEVARDRVGVKRLYFRFTDLLPFANSGRRRLDVESGWYREQLQSQPQAGEVVVLSTRTDSGWQQRGLGGAREPSLLINGVFAGWPVKEPSATPIALSYRGQLTSDISNILTLCSLLGSGLYLWFSRRRVIS